MPYAHIDFKIVYAFLCWSIVLSSCAPVENGVEILEDQEIEDVMTLFLERSLAEEEPIFHEDALLSILFPAEASEEEQTIAEEKSLENIDFLNDKIKKGRSASEWADLMETFSADADISFYSYRNILASTNSFSRPRSKDAWVQSYGNSKNFGGHLYFKGRLELNWVSSVGVGSGKGYFLPSDPFIVTDTMVYVLDAYSQLIAVDKENGKRLWLKKLVQSKDRIHSPGGLAWGNSTIYVTTGLGSIIAVDSESQEILWRQDIGSPFRSPPTVFDHYLVAITVDNFVVFLDQDSGDILWSGGGEVATTAFLGGASPAVDGDLIIAPFTTGEVVALSTQDGTISWIEKMMSLKPSASSFAHAKEHVKASPVIYDGKVLLASQSTGLVMLDLKSGKRIWKKALKIISTPWVDSNIFFAMNTLNDVLAISVEDGSVLWSSPALKTKKEDRKASVKWYGPVLAGESLWFVGSHGKLLILSPYDGSIISERTLPAGGASMPVIVDNTLYIFTQRGALLSFSSQ